MSTDPIDHPVPDPPSPAEVASEENLVVTLHFDYPRSDIVLRSRDSHNFHVSKLYIVLSSPVLRELMRTASNTSNVADGEEPESLPVVNLPDRGATLHGLLTFIFPVVPVLPSTSDEIIELLAAAQKYQMDSVLSHIRGVIARKDPPFIRPETAFRIYFLAQQHELREEAVQSARVTLRLPMVIEDLVDKLDFPGTTGAYLHELWRYHEQVRSDLKSGVLEFRNSGLPEDVKGLRCMTRYSNSSFSSPNDRTHPPWLDDYIKSIADAPHLFDLISFENARARHLQNSTKIAASCSCLVMSGKIKRSFWAALAAVVHGAIEKADSTLALVREQATLENLDASSIPLCLHVTEANIILRSSDEAEFRVHKSLLSMPSPFFEATFTLPQPLAPDDKLVDGLPVVQLPEDADLLSCLISLLYPIPPVIPGSYQKVFALLAACQKYEMVSIQQEIRDKVKLGRFPAPVKTEAFSAYAIASSLRLEPEKEHAARLTLGQPLTFGSLGQELRQFKGSALCELIRYRVANSGGGNR